MVKAKGGKNNKQQAAKGKQPGSKDPKQSVLKAGSSNRSSNTDTAGGSKRNRRSSNGNGNARRGRSGSRNTESREKKKPLTAEELDGEMDDYWIKNSNKEVVEKKLDEDMDAYWDKKEQGKVVDPEPATKEVAEENNAEDVADETKTGDEEEADVES
mmetsp:Transcript_10104/g.11807  ORF Transcript_10104/g.11807 Transcript_10104/m.11807 type:complete len:157 (+) Transcript_10104:158-628(+)